MARLSRSKSFNVAEPGSRRAAGVVLALCFSGWAIHLGALAGLQSQCAEELSPGSNDPKVVQGLLDQTRPLVVALTLSPDVNSNQNAQILLGINKNIIDMVLALSWRAGNSFAVTPDDTCTQYFRYQWLNSALEFVVLALCAYAMWAGVLHQARVAVGYLVVIASMLCIQNAHTFYTWIPAYAGAYVPDNYHRQSKVFVAGCIISTAGNLMLLMLLGMHDESADVGKSMRIPAFVLNEARQKEAQADAN